MKKDYIRFRYHKSDKETYCFEPAISILPEHILNEIVKLCSRSENGQIFIFTEAKNFNDSVSMIKEFYGENLSYEKI